MTRSNPDANKRRSEGPSSAGEAGAAEAVLSAVAAARDRPGMLAKVLRVLEAADAACSDEAAPPRRPLCLGGGACCRFDLMGHRVYVSTGELALLASRRPPAPERAAALRCPYQVGPACRARADRPLGCRVYFCRDVDGAAQSERYESAHEALRELHARHGVPYVYVEMTWALGVLDAEDFCAQAPNRPGFCVDSARAPH